MRPIDADRLLEKVEKIQPWEPYLGKYAQGIRHCMEIVSLFIKDAPTIEPSAQPENAQKNERKTHACDCISRQAAISLPVKPKEDRYFQTQNLDDAYDYGWCDLQECIEKMPSAQPEPRYTEEELRVFKHGISLSLLSKRSSQHWQYDEDTATEIKFLERLYEKVSADMRGEKNETD